jgi:excisionase family DNA binding protein
MKPAKPDQPPESGFLTVREVARRWQISRRQVHRYIKSGDLKVHHFGRAVRIAMDDVLLFEFRCRGVS